jgi:hypothetical protein
MALRFLRQDNFHGQRETRKLRIDVGLRRATASIPVCFISIITKGFA